MSETILAGHHAASLFELSSSALSGKEEVSCHTVCEIAGRRVALIYRRSPGFDIETQFVRTGIPE